MSGSTEHDLTGIVTGGTSLTPGPTDPVAIRVCETGNDTVRLVPGSAAPFLIPQPRSPCDRCGDEWQRDTSQRDKITVAAIRLAVRHHNDRIVR
jgi:hypothetical protein